MATSSIEWTNQTWNPVVGCTWASAGCDHCYAATMTRRLEAMGQADYAGLTSKKHFNGTVRTLGSKLDIPLRRRKPTMYFVNSMSDLFHKDVPFDFIDRVFAVMALCPQHTFQILTKRPERMAEYFQSEIGTGAWNRSRGWDYSPTAKTMIECSGRAQAWPLPNVWLGTSVENQATADERITHLMKVPAAARFLSCEPLLGAIDIIKSLSDAADEFAWEAAHEAGGECELCGGEGVREYNDAPDEWGEDCPSEVNHLIPCRGCEELQRWKRVHVASKAGLGWLIAGGESGPGARPCDIAWIRSLVSQCKAAGVAPFVKQLGSKAIDGTCAMGTNPGYLAYIDRKGGDMAEWPADLRVREMPIAK